MPRKQRICLGERGVCGAGGDNSDWLQRQMVFLCQPRRLCSLSTQVTLKRELWRVLTTFLRMSLTECRMKRGWQHIRKVPEVWNSTVPQGGRKVVLWALREFLLTSIGVETKINLDRSGEDRFAGGSLEDHSWPGQVLAGEQACLRGLLEICSLRAILDHDLVKDNHGPERQK